MENLLYGLAISQAAHTKIQLNKIGDLYMNYALLRAQV